MSRLQQLITIGQGVLVLPFLDREEGDKVHVQKEISYIIQKFPFQWSNYSLNRKGMWRFYGKTYLRTKINTAVYYNNKLCGMYAYQCDAITPVYQKKLFTDNHFIHFVTINEITYLIHRTNTLWLFTEGRVHGPYYEINGRVVECHLNFKQRKQLHDEEILKIEHNLIHKDFKDLK